MFIKDELKLNKFRDCAIPSNREYFARYGFAVTPASQYTGDDVSLPMPMNKVESMADYMAYAEEMAENQSDENE